MSDPLYMLLEDQNKAIIDTIRKYELNPLDLKPTQEGNIFTFSFKPSSGRLYFTLTQLDSFKKFNISHTSFNPNFRKVEYFHAGSDKRRKFSFEESLSYFDAWLNDSVSQFNKEVSKLSSWDLLLEESRPGNSYEDSHRLLSDEERDIYNERLNVLEKVLTDQFDLLESEIEILKKAIQELKDQLKNLSKPIWQRVARTVLVDIVKDLATDDEKQHKMLETIRGVVSSSGDGFSGMLGL